MSIGWGVSDLQGAEFCHFPRYCACDTGDRYCCPLYTVLVVGLTDSCHLFCTIAAHFLPADHHSILSRVVSDKNCLSPRIVVSYGSISYRHIVSNRTEYQIVCFYSELMTRIQEATNIHYSVAIVTTFDIVMPTVYFICADQIFFVCLCIYSPVGSWQGGCPLAAPIFGCRKVGGEFFSQKIFVQ